ncbi:hypothetical protein JCM19274_2098 [Algibacter lectus]|uniref:Uncharacterized protein n=1 Tax=Algibacter lectus TaxID=221126 RepID=A0A090WZC3_9FLAO|nr:hypothetical protein JCM19274_2098 [Algibacter lectus]
MAMAAVISGEATKACVFGFPSARLAKFRLNECTMLFFGAFFGSLYLAHCPIHGPQAFVNIFASRFSKSLKYHHDLLCSVLALILD